MFKGPLQPGKKESLFPTSQANPQFDRTPPGPRRRSPDNRKIQPVQIFLDSEVNRAIISFAQETSVLFQPPGAAIWGLESSDYHPVLEAQSEPYNLLPGNVTVVKSQDLHFIQFGKKDNPNKKFLVHFIKDTGIPYLLSMSDQTRRDYENILKLPTDDPQVFTVERGEQPLEITLVVCGKELEGAEPDLPETSYLFIENLAAGDVLLHFKQKISTKRKPILHPSQPKKRLR